MTQSWLSSATVWLFTRLFVVIRKKKKVRLWGVVPGARDCSMGTWLVQRPGPWGEASERAGGPAGARGPGSGIGSGPTCFVM